MINTEINSADQLGAILAHIATLTAQADKIKDSMKNIATAGGPTVFEGSLFKCTHTETDRCVFDKATFVKEFGDAFYAKYTKTTAVFSIRTTSR